MVRFRRFLKLPDFVYALIIAGCALTSVSAAELPVLHLRKASTPPPLLPTLQYPAEASAWYGASPTWFGMGGKTGERNHTEVLATYDSTALYIAFLNIDRATIKVQKSTVTDLRTVDSNAIWIETPAGKRFCLMTAIDNSYPPIVKRASGEIATFDPKLDKLAGWSSQGWYAGSKTIQQTIRIPWSTLATTAPAAGSRWRINFANYNQISTVLTTPVHRQLWAPGTESQLDQWGYLAFDEAAYTPANCSPEAILTLRPGKGFGGETTLRAGDYADQTNTQKDEAITQSNWNDWDPIQYTIKEYTQFDLSMIPSDRQIISAVLRQNFRGHYESNPTDLYIHVVRLAGAYDPLTVTMMTSPVPVENSYRRLVTVGEKGSWIDFDVTDAVAKAFASGAPKASFALAGSSGDIHNGKIWNVSFGRADYYDQSRPRLIITFGKPDVTFNSPINIGSTNYTSVATSTSKNKLTNGTFAYGTVEGVTNATYWDANPAFVYSGGQNVPLMQMVGDTNPNTGHKALRFSCVSGWKAMKQMATGLSAGKTYTVSGWMKGSAAGVKSDIRLAFKDANDVTISSSQASYGGSGGWQQVKLTKVAPAGTVKALVSLVNSTSGAGTYMLYSDFQMEEGSAATAYSETMGFYYPNHPRTGGTTPQPTATPTLALTLSADKTTAKPGETVTYTLAYKNTGSGAAIGAVIESPISATCTYVAGSASNGGVYDSVNRKVVWTIGNVAAGASGSLQYRVTIQ